MLTRRSFLWAAGAAPTIVSASSLMPIWVPRWAREPERVMLVVDDGWGVDWARPGGDRTAYWWPENEAHRRWQEARNREMRARLDAMQVRGRV